MEDSNFGKIEATVIEILKSSANMEELTELKVRVTVAERLGMEMSQQHKVFIREVIESFLVSNATEEDVEEAKREFASQVNKPKKDVHGNIVICKLSKKRNVFLREIGGNKCITIGDYAEKDGNQLAAAIRRGINITPGQWSALKKNMPLIDKAVKKIQTKSRPKLDDEPREDKSKSAKPVHEFVPVETIRFDGKNYQTWAPLMETFLKQLNVAYVLAVPGPSPRPEASSSEEATDTERKWKNDDYICRHNILSCLSDHLYNQFLKKTKSAKELWEQLKLLYLYEEHGTKRYNVKKYIEYQMVEGKSITEQVHDLNMIADSIVAAGWLIDENFHVSTIISKLPPSWKDFSIKLSREENLPFPVLMDHIRGEEGFRNPNKYSEPSNFLEFNPGKTHGGPRIREVKRPPTSWKRRETETSNKNIFCDFCNKRGHLSKNCWHKNKDLKPKNNE
ncbi:hypothetical protein ACFE04_019087 [Oxalis oulophora]